ncbi:hypothetical protein KR009_006450 [Drosophila setifemur]|nr:hypothetical protein KR009_006450 [Drosophila setifemur]
MDFHILIVIGCVFSASLLSFLFINKIFRRKTFEEVVAEKRAMSANLYKAAGGATTKKPKKKDLKREKKQRQREQQRDVTEQEQDEPEDYSDGQSEGQGSVADEEPGLSKQHVEFEPDAEILNEQRRPSSLAEKENQPSVGGKKGKKDKRNGAGSKAAGILVNKNETVPVKAPSSEETPTLNNFETKVPKDMVELKKHEQKERKEDNNNKQQAQKKNGAGNVPKKEKPTAASDPEPPIAPKILKQQQQQNGSPKTQHNQVNNKTKQQQHNNKQKQKETLTGKDLAQALDKLAEYQNQTIGVNALMNVFSRAELNRSEIQILIDYLLNKQQDMPASHSEWSDDICQKLKRQLEEKEKLLTEEQEASIGIQAKLRELRQEVNTERAQMHARIQVYNEKVQAKEQELAAVNQELSSLNEKLSLERQQFQTVLRENQASSQDLLPQLQRLQQDLAHKEKCLSDMTAFVNAETQQKNELIQQQAQQLLALEQQRDELEQRQNNSIFELEQRKQLDQENAELKQELCNLTQAQSELQRVHAAELQELRQQSSALEAGNQALNQQLSQAANSAVQATAAQSEQAQVQSEAMLQKQQELSALRSQLGSLTDAQAQQQKQANTLQSQLQEAQQRADQLQAKEKQLQLELQEQREKNNDVRMKNWKLIEALQNAEASTAKTKTNTAQSVGQQHIELQQQKQQLNGGGSATSSAKSEQQRIRDLYQRLYPDAVKAQAGSALQASFDQWLEQVLTTYVKQQQEKLQKQINSSHKSTQSNSSSSSNHNSTHNNISSNNSSSNSQYPSAASSAVEQQELHKQNLQLRECNEKLTQLVTKTTNTLMDLEERAREQDEHWRGIVDQKEQLILKLQQYASNGEQVKIINIQN